MNNLSKVVDLFMQENDEKALKELYKITNDEIVKNEYDGMVLKEAMRATIPIFSGTEVEITCGCLYS